MGQPSAPGVSRRQSNGSVRGGRADSAHAGAVAAILRESRLALGLSQRRLSDLSAEYGVPVSRSAICDIERGCNMPGVESLVSLCNALQLDPHEILERVVSQSELVGDLARSSIAEMKRRLQVLYWSCRFRAAASVCSALLARLEHEAKGDPTERRDFHARVEISRASALRRSGRFQAAEAAVTRSLHVAATSADVQAESLLTLARIHLEQAVLPLARAESEEAVRLAQIGGTPRVLAFAWSAKGAYLHCATRYEDAVEAYKSARDFSVQAADERIQADAEGGIGLCLLELGHPLAALKKYTVAVELARKGGDRNGEAAWQLDIGRLALRLDSPDEAERRAAAALTIARTGDRYLSIFKGIWLQHQVARRRDSGNPDRRRVAYLKRLYPRVAGANGTDEIREFRREILGLDVP